MSGTWKPSRDLLRQARELNERREHRVLGRPPGMKPAPPVAVAPTTAVALILPHKAMLGFDGGAIGADIYLRPQRDPRVHDR
jgi:hypothetical protein